MPPSKRRTARDIMMPLYACPVIYEDETIKRALIKFQFLLCSNQSKKLLLVVINRQDIPIGWLLPEDLLAAIFGKSYKSRHNLSELTGPFAHYVREIINLVPDSWETLTEQCHKAAGKQVGEIIRLFKNDAVDGEAGFKEVISVMHRHNLYTLPVIDRNKLIGFVRAEDIMLEMLRMLIDAPLQTKFTAVPAAHSP